MQIVFKFRFYGRGTTASQMQRPVGYLGKQSQFSLRIKLNSRNGHRAELLNVKLGNRVMKEERKLSTVVKKYKDASNDNIFITSFLKIRHLIEALLGGTHTETWYRNPLFRKE